MTSIGNRPYTMYLCLLFTGGCAYADGSTIVTGTTRTAMDSTLVRIYLEPPSDYEVIGIVNASGTGWTAQESQDMAIAELKKQAAKLGANGVLLGMAGERTSSTVAGYNAGFAYAVPVTAKTVSGKAIYIMPQRDTCRRSGLIQSAIFRAVCPIEQGAEWIEYASDGSRQPWGCKDKQNR